MDGEQSGGQPPVTTLDDTARHILQSAADLRPLIASVQQHLREEQAELVYSPRSYGARASGGGISDPTYDAMRRLAGYRRFDRQMASALNRIVRAMADAESVFTSVIGESGRFLRGEIPDDHPRCPGWSEEKRERLGGCGKHLETWRDAKGNEHIRSTWLCTGCRKEMERSEKEGAA